MSYSTLYVSDKDGDMVAGAEYRNGHGTAPYVWCALCVKLGLREFGDWDKLWKDGYHEPGRGLTALEINVLRLTYDDVLIEGKDLAAVAAQLREFCALHPQPERVNHWPAIADELDRLAGEGCLGVGIHHTSVACDGIWVEGKPSGDAPEVCVHCGEDPFNEDPEVRPYNILKDTDHCVLVLKPTHPTPGDSK